MTDDRDDPTPDDIYDIQDFVGELRHWIMKRRARCNPEYMSFIIIFTGAEVAWRHMVDRENFDNFAKNALDLGVQFGGNDWL